MPSIMDMFRTVAPKPAVVVDDAAAKAAAASSTPGTAASPNKEGTGPAAFPAAAVGDKSPLSGYDKLWETDPNATPTPTGVPAFNVDPKKLLDAAKNIDFTKVIPGDVLEKASKGDVAALGQAINVAAQAGYAQSAAATTRIVQEALTQQAKTFKTEIMPAILREHSVSQTLVDESILTNPAVAPMVGAVKQQFSTKYPNASAAEIAKHTVEYFRDFSENFMKMQGYTVDKTDTKAVAAAAAKQEDWGKFFDVPNDV